MANPREVVRVVIGGAISNQDSWSIGLNYIAGSISPAPTSAEMNTLANTISGLWTTHYWKTGAGLGLATNGPATNFSRVQTYYYNTANTLTAQGGVAVAPVVGSSTFVAPAYVAKVVTLRTQQYGRSFRGRFYLPQTAPALSTSTYQFTDVGTTGPGIRAFLQAMNALTPTLGGTSSPWALSVWSSKLNGGSFVNSMGIDSLPDTQRGRQNMAVAGTTYTNTV